MENVIVLNRPDPDYIALRKAYPYAAAYCDYMGSFDYYTHAELQRLADMQAPADTVIHHEADDRLWTLADYPQESRFRHYLAVNHPELIGYRLTVAPYNPYLEVTLDGRRLPFHGMALPVNDSNWKTVAEALADPINAEFVKAWQDLVDAANRGLNLK